MKKKRKNKDEVKMSVIGSLMDDEDVDKENLPQRKTT